MHFHRDETVALEVRVPRSIYNAVAESGESIQKDDEALMAEAFSYALADAYAPAWKFREVPIPKTVVDAYDPDNGFTEETKEQILAAVEAFARRKAFNKIRAVTIPVVFSADIETEYAETPGFSEEAFATFLAAAEESISLHSQSKPVVTHHWKWQNSAKEYDCSGCDERIVKGERYARCQTVEDGRWGSIDMFHDACAPVAEHEPLRPYPTEDQ